MYEAAALGEDDEILKSLQKAMEDFHRIKDEIQHSAGKSQTGNAEQVLELADLASTVV